MNFSWMAWTMPTAFFFGAIATLILSMFFWELISPGGNPRVGVLRLSTTRGDRLFMSLLCSAFLALGWLALVPLQLWWVLPVCVVFAVLRFRFC